MAHGQVAEAWTIASPAAFAKAKGYVALTKPRIIELLLVTTLPTMVVAQRGMPAVSLMVWTLLGGTLAAGGANAINMVIDRDIDAVMHRTRNRPLVTGVMSARAALTFAIGLEVAAFGLLATKVNLLSAVLAVSATLFYVFIYSLWLKRSTSKNIVIGGAAGAVPVLVGWAAVTGSLGWAPFVLFGIILFWTPPHTWALAVKYREDYSAAEVPMLPAVASLRTTSVQILAYTFALWAVTLGFAPVASMGLLYVVSALVLGGVFTFFALQLLRDPTPGRAMSLFTWSISYISLLFGAMALDQLLRSGF
ncbi:MAG: heme o synthase [Acidimicrobiales bacterium]